MPGFYSFGERVFPPSDFDLIEVRGTEIVWSSISGERRALVTRGGLDTRT